ncbi:hypothetical protein PENANT_c002G08258 [Penicillium antarcticum]|uniref:Uncharacterized protein n=1 Tax=Penicillium antarcticum TaxID=416450 RepID=A0A1V6QKM7_9EURO|nr:hypothetical protein PENANT_c002G08258 [Penicillium antarcticum]
MGNLQTGDTAPSLLPKDLYDMRVIAYLLSGVYATTALAASYPSPGSDAYAEAEAECGSLGVMTVDPDNLPEGVTLAVVRKCREHPLGHLAYPGADDLLRRWLPDWFF